MTATIDISNAISSLKSDYPICFSKILAIQNALPGFDCYAAADDWVFRNGLSVGIIPNDAGSFRPFINYHENNVLGRAKDRDDFRDYQLFQTEADAYKRAFQVAFNQLEDVSAFIELR